MAATPSHKSKPNSSFFKNIQNSHFKKIFLKNWLTVFISIVLPLIICVLSLHWQSRQSLLNEIDEGARRSTLNTAATLEALFQEASSTLDNAWVPSRHTASFPISSSISCLKGNSRHVSPSCWKV